MNRLLLILLVAPTLGSCAHSVQLDQGAIIYQGPNEHLASATATVAATISLNNSLQSEQTISVSDEVKLGLILNRYIQNRISRDLILFYRCKLDRRINYAVLAENEANSIVFIRSVATTQVTEECHQLDLVYRVNKITNSVDVFVR